MNRSPSYKVGPFSPLPKGPQFGAFPVGRLQPAALDIFKSLIEEELKKGANTQDDPRTKRTTMEYGYSFFKHALSASLCTEVRGKIDKLIHKNYDGSAKRGNFDHYKTVFNRDPYWLNFIDRAGFIEPIEELLGSECHIIGMSAWRTPPGGGRKKVDMHIDQIFIPMPDTYLTTGRVKLPIFIMTLQYYLSACNIKCCPTWIIPGSHLSGRAPSHKYTDIPVGHSGILAGDELEWNGKKAEPVITSEGDALLMRSELWHRGSRNETTNQTRYMLQIHYAQRGIAQRFPPHTKFVHNPVVMAEASERQKRLLGKHQISAYG